jgi:hypothetical protein
MDKRLTKALTLNKMEDNLLAHKIAGISKTEHQLHRELMHIQRARLSFQKDMANLKLLDEKRFSNTRQDSLVSRKYTKVVHARRRSSAENALEMSLTGSIKLPEIKPKGKAAWTEKFEVESELKNHVVNYVTETKNTKSYPSVPLVTDVQSIPLGGRDEDIGTKGRLTRRRSEPNKENKNENEAGSDIDDVETCAVTPKGADVFLRRRSKDLIDIDEKQRLYTRRGRRASAPVIMAHPQLPKTCTRSQPPGIFARKTNQDFINDERLKGTFRTIGRSGLGAAILSNARRKSIISVPEKYCQN